MISFGAFPVWEGVKIDELKESETDPQMEIEDGKLPAKIRSER